MNKIPTLFRRDSENRRHLLPEITPGCEWVLAGEGIATRKYDGTCCMRDENEVWWARREVKPGKQAPEEFQAVETDETTGKTVGWEPIEQSPFVKFHTQAINEGDFFPTGTYELCGPKVQGNPERFEVHTLIRHEDAEKLSYNFTQNIPEKIFIELKELLNSKFPFEGIVWHHPDGRMAKIKRRDFV